ncbi:divergent polysaccharide deacetylase family protein [Lachnospiraceae bacterium NSJ-143]|nr:divergent polysaccharide deacetylase family protein [Lachnospiraceae bacterium NSJ-143]
MFAVISVKKLKKAAVITMAAAAVVFCARGVFNKKSILTMADGGQKGYLAIVIDDFGYTGEGTPEMLALDIPLTAAIMPFSDHTAEDLQSVKDAGKDYIIHMPMESLTGKKSWVGDKGIFTSMQSEEIANRVDEAFSILEGASGMNNHMGSAVMESEKTLSAVLDEAKKYNSVFIDSVTSGKSTGQRLCEEKEIPFLKRDVFLDSTDDINVVIKRLEEAGDKALKNGKAVAIGHVGPEGGKITAKAIEKMYPELMAKGVEFVTISRMRELIENESGAAD